MWVSYKYLPYHASSYPNFLQYFITHRNSNFLFYTFYFVFGAVIAIELERWRKIIKGSFRWNFSLLLVAYCWAGYELIAGSGTNLPIELNWSTTLKPSMFMLIFAELIALYMIGIKISQKNNWINKLTSWLGKYSFGAYLVHALILGELVKIIDSFHMMYPALNQHYVLVTFIAFVIVSVVSASICFMFSKIPFGRYLIGPTGDRITNIRLNKELTNKT